MDETTVSPRARCTRPSSTRSGGANTSARLCRCHRSPTFPPWHLAVICFRRVATHTSHTTHTSVKLLPRREVFRRHCKLPGVLATQSCHPRGVVRGPCPFEFPGWRGGTSLCVPQIVPHVTDEVIATLQRVARRRGRRPRERGRERDPTVTSVTPSQIESPPGHYSVPIFWSLMSS